MRATSDDLPDDGSVVHQFRTDLVDVSVLPIQSSLPIQASGGGPSSHGHSRRRAALDNRLRRNTYEPTAPSSPGSSHNPASVEPSCALDALPLLHAAIST